jgi:hypothetical protein
MELLKLPNEEFKEDFRNWLIEQSPKNFKTLSGYEILKSYIIFRYGSTFVFNFCALVFSLTTKIKTNKKRCFIKKTFIY